MIYRYHRLFSVWLCQLLLCQLCSNLDSSLFNRYKLRDSTVLELGYYYCSSAFFVKSDCLLLRTCSAGTGLLGLVVAPWVQRYITTDLDYLLPLIRKNITHNKANILHELSKSSGFALQPDTITVDSLDWIQLLHTSPASRYQLFRLPPPNQSISTPNAQVLDLIFVVDCIFNPSLLPGLVETIDHFAVPGRTKVVVAVELRSEEVIRDFLELWLGKGGWEVWRVGDLSDGNGERLDVSFAIWVGMKVGK